MSTALEAGADRTVRSFRDPAGALFRHKGRILRAVAAADASILEAFLETETARQAIDAGKFVRTFRIPAAEVPGSALTRDLEDHQWFEHERVPFPSFPYEWPAEMLAAAGSLTIDLAQAALDEGFGLKDATPYNVLFRGPRPVFVDVLSFERREPRDRTWMAYGQFVRTFLLPLLAHRDLGAPLQAVLFAHRDGLDPEGLYRWAGFWRRWMPPYLPLVTLPKLLGGNQAQREVSYAPQLSKSPEQARFVLGRLLASCGGQLRSVARSRDSKDAPPDSLWSGYLDGKSLYTPEQLAQKEAFVSEALVRAQPRRVLDVGANEGRFSFLAARSGASVVAIDSDPVVAGTIWRQASREGLDVLPLVVDLTRPTPAMGWRNKECESFLERARESFDMVLWLAVIHHMLVSERIPLEDLLALTSELTRDYAVIEFVAPEDPMFRRIARGREGLYAHLTKERFESAAGAHFELVRSMQMDGLHRCLYLFRRRRAAN